MTLLEHLQAYLIGNAPAPGIRKPSDAGDAYPLWLHPRDGTPAPGEGEGEEPHPDLVLGAIPLAGPPTVAHEGDTYRYDLIEIRMRARKSPYATELEQALRPLLHDRRNYDLAGKRVIESLIARELAPLGSGPQGYTFGIQYLFQTYITDP